jgi:hypothetical protein
VESEREAGHEERQHSGIRQRQRCAERQRFHDGLSVSMYPTPRTV